MRLGDAMGDSGVHAPTTPESSIERLRSRRLDDSGSGPIYPARYRASPVEGEGNLYRVIRYVERNPCAAGLTVAPADWRWSSASPRCPIRLAAWPVPRPPDWAAYVGQAIESDELKRIRECLKAEPLRRRRASAGRSDW
jgi:hypothetical protein